MSEWIAVLLMISLSLAVGAFWLWRMFEPWRRNVMLRIWRLAKYEATGKYPHGEFPEGWRPWSDDWEKPS